MSSIVDIVTPTGWTCYYRIQPGGELSERRAVPGEVEMLEVQPNGDEDR